MRLPWNSGIVGNARPWPDGQPQTRLELEKSDCSIFEFTPDYSGRSQAETIPVESDGSLQVIDPDRNNRYSRLHPVTFGLFRPTSKDQSRGKRASDNQQGIDPSRMIDPEAEAKIVDE